MKIITKIQSIFGVTRSEVIFSAVILSGLILGVIYKYAVPAENTAYRELKKEIYRMQDSIAVSQQAAYSGSSQTFIAENDDTQGTGNNNSSKPFPDGKININTASLTELMELPGVGEATAGNILLFRKKQKFDKPDDIMLVKGIGIKKFDKMRQFIVVD